MSTRGVVHFVPSNQSHLIFTTAYHAAHAQQCGLNYGERAALVRGREDAHSNRQVPFGRSRLHNELRLLKESGRKWKEIRS